MKIKIHVEESTSDLPTDIDENKLHDDDVSADGDYFTERGECLIWREFGRDSNFMVPTFVVFTLGALSAEVRIPLRATLAICAETERNISMSFNIFVLPTVKSFNSNICS